MPGIGDWRSANSDSLQEQGEQAMTTILVLRARRVVSALTLSLAAATANTSAAAPPATNSPTSPPTTVASATPTQVDVLAEVRGWNEGKFSPPPTEFRKGEAT